MKTTLSSRERVLAAMSGEIPDRVPVVLYTAAPIPALEHCWNDRLGRAEYLLSLGADEIYLFSPPWPLHPAVTTRSWREEGARYPVLYRQFDTPAGPLRMGVNVTADWQVGELPMYADHFWPRTVEPLIKGEADLARLRYLFHDPRRTDLSALRERVAYLQRACRRLGILFQAWLHPAPLHTMAFLGARDLSYLVRDNPGLVRHTLQVAQEWSRAHLELLLDLGVDCIYYSGCYETVDFFAPADVRELFLPIVAENVRITHQAGVRFQYFVLTGGSPFLEDYAAIGIDVLSGLDAGGANPTDPVTAKQKIGGRVCLVGGIDPRQAFEQGTPEDVRQLVVQALRDMAPGGGYILSTSGSFEAPARAENILALIRCGLEYGRYPIAESIHRG